MIEETTKRRSVSQLHHDILLQLIYERNGLPQTKLMQKANMNTLTIKPHLFKLSVLGMIHRPRTDLKWRITRKGIDYLLFLKSHTEVQRI